MIIGLNGLKGSGKDTAGAYLVSEYGFVRASFADLLKESAAALFGIDPARWDKLKNDKNARITFSRTYSEPGTPDATEYIKILTAREFLQLYGTEAHRDVFGPDFWVTALFDRLDDELLYNGDVVITDARFANEIAAIHKMGGVIWQVDRMLHGLALQPDTHASESLPDLSLVDRIVQNHGSIEELHAEIDVLMWIRSEARG